MQLLFLVMGPKMGYWHCRGDALQWRRWNFVRRGTRGLLPRAKFYLYGCRCVGLPPQNL